FAYRASVISGPDGGTVLFAVAARRTSGRGSQAVDATTGKASCRVSYGAAGSHQIQATYSGDASFGGSSSSALTQTVSPVTSTGLGPSQNPPPAGDQVTYSAAVSPATHGRT